MNSSQPRTIVIATGLFILTSAAARAGQSAAVAPSRPITVMTQNVYNGVDAQIAAIPLATSPADLIAKVGAVYNGYFARRFPERAAALANEILLARPDVIGLQEAVMLRTQEPADGSATPATNVELDYVQILLDALTARGLAYKVVGESIGLDVELPGAIAPGRIVDVRHTDREVILARADLQSNALTIANSQGGHFQVNCAVPILGGSIVIPRGWVSVDASTGSRKVRIVSTHLDADCLPFTTAIQESQALEILAGPAATSLPVVLIGDFNSPADGTGDTYKLVTGTAGQFTDSWTRSGLGAGLTCCQAADLLNVSSTLNERVDLVLFRGSLTPLASVTVGDRPIFKTPSGLWPSDHAGVVAVLVPR